LRLVLDGQSSAPRGLALVDWLTMITEFVGMTAALSLFGVPRIVTVLGAWIVMLAMVLQGRMLRQTKRFQQRGYLRGYFLKDGTRTLFVVPAHRSRLPLVLLSIYM